MRDPQVRAWDRALWRPGGGPAELWWAVYGTFPEPPQPSRSRHRIGAIPSTLTLHEVRSDAPSFAAPFTGDLGRLLTHQDAALVEAARRAPQCFVIRALEPDPPDFAYLRDAVGVVQAALDAGGVAVLDPLRLWLWSAAAWRERVFDVDAAPIFEHITTLVSERDGAMWVHTRGLTKFGRPDVGVYGVPPADVPAAVELAQRIADLQARGDQVAEGREIGLAGMPRGMRVRYAGHRDDPDYNNVHLRIDWNG